MVRRGKNFNMLWLAVGIGIFLIFWIGPMFAPDFTMPEWSRPSFKEAFKGPGEAPPFGNDDRGINLLKYAVQGAEIVAMPAALSGMMVMMLATLAGLIRCAGVSWFDTVLQSFAEIVGALPRLVVVLVVAIAMPPDYRTLLPIGLTWALLAAPGAMDEAAATAGRLGGERFVECLRAHGFNAPRIYLYHVVWKNLRSVIVRQGAEVMMQVIFLEIALSYLAVSENEPSFTHSEATYSWATLLYQGYSALLGQDLMHSLILGLTLVAATAIMAQAIRLSARPR